MRIGKVEIASKRGNVALNPVEFEVAVRKFGALLLDTRDPQVFAKGYVPNSINISIDGSFAVWVGTLIRDVNQVLLFISEEGREKEVMTRLAKLGYNHILGFLKGGIKSWRKEEKEVDTVKSISIEVLQMIQEKKGKIQVLDVRNKSEYKTEHVKGASNFPLEYINEYIDKILKDQTYYIHSSVGFRSMVFISILKARGYKKLVDLQGGFKALKSSGKFEITDYVCPTTLLG